MIKKIMKRLEDYINESAGLNLDEMLEKIKQTKHQENINEIIEEYFKQCSDSNDVINLINTLNANKIKWVGSSLLKYVDDLRELIYTIMTRCRNGRSNLLLDLNFIDTSKMPSLEEVFKSYDRYPYKCSIDVSKWDVSGVKNLYSTFMNFDGNIIGLENWDVSHVENMLMTFYKCGNPGMVLDLSKWNTSNVKIMNSTFMRFKGYVKGLENWNVSKVTNMGNMFHGVAEKFDLDLSKWNISKVDNTEEMFYRFSGDITGLENWDFSNVKNYTGMLDKTNILKNFQSSRCRE